MEGTDKENFAEAISIVNALYRAIGQDNPLAGELFRCTVRQFDYVWQSGVITESTTIVIPSTGKGE